MPRFPLLPVLCLGALLSGTSVHADNGRNIILVTLDGMRWQEVFHGIDPVLADIGEYAVQGEVIREHFAAGTAAASAVKLMPFLNTTVAGSGVLLGDRKAGSCMQVSNPWFFSYPGYNELLTGKADPEIDSNAAVPNRNHSFLEWLQHDVDGFAGRIAAFASWNVFPYIINSERSGIPVNVGKLDNPVSEEERLLNRLHEELPAIWETVRLDALTHRLALSYLKREQPRVLYIAYGETDDFAHDGHYDQYLMAAHRSDAFLRELWDTVQSLEAYRDNTVLLVTTDHGRGHEPQETWQHHASRRAMEGYMQNLAEYRDGIVGSDAVWLAALGPGIRPGAGFGQQDCASTDQIAATILSLLGLDYRRFDPSAGAPLSSLLKQ